MKDKSFFSNNKDMKTASIFLFPALLLYALIIIYPTLYSFVLSFFEWNGLDPVKKFVGLKHYTSLFSDKLFFLSMKNTFQFVIVTVFFQSFVALILANMIESVKGERSRTFFRVSFFVPALISAAVVALMWSYVFHPHSGFLNRGLSLLAGKRVLKFWLADKKLVMWAIIIANMWQWIGFNVLIFCAGIQSISKSLYEAAEIDGAGLVAKFFYITIPSLKHVISVVVITTMINGLKVFDLVRVMTGGGPNHASEVATSYLYINAFKFGKLGYASAIGYALTFLSMILTIIYIKVVQNEDD